MLQDSLTNDAIESAISMLVSVPAEQVTPVVVGQLLPGLMPMKKDSFAALMGWLWTAWSPLWMAVRVYAVGGGVGARLQGLSSDEEGEGGDDEGG